MIGNWARCAAQIRIYEGGYVNHPKDPGGPTNMGITIATLSGHRHVKVTADDVRNLTWDEAADIYRPAYWDAVQGDKLPAGVDLVVFDRGVLSGPVMAVKLLQEALGVRVDGHAGPATIAAAVAADAARLIRAFEAKAEAYIRRLETFHVFGTGWDARIAHVQATALSMVGKDLHIVSASPAVQAALVPQAAAFTPAEVRGKADPRSVDVGRTKVGQAQGLGIAGAAVTFVSTAAQHSGVFSDLGDKLGAAATFGGHAFEVAASGCGLLGAGLAVVAIFGRAKDKEELSA